ncbi:tyrosine-protein phosphatase [Kitasatospora viridis]|uniref:Protein-tyrosine phosphatase n=1 Tax=Kitasatospora viridis TaxID=281105 RepID=A0A561UI17_9ACTN|nr:tyrosine-protein phosphatase [Kitasatospora viridis]TWF99005.1 protein-tyrosine phosphatase [Kitasatospora viridis]
MTEQPDQSAPTARSLGLAGAVNARDLGGYRTVDGRVLRSGVALRSDGLHRLRAADHEVLGGFGVRHVVDLRSLDEVRDAGPDLLPGLPVAELPTGAPDLTLTVRGAGPDGPTMHHLPVYAADFDVHAALRGALADPDPTTQRALLGDGRADRMMLRLYRWFVTGPAARERFAAVLRLLAEPQAPPVLFHCTAGKDRTGWTAALLLTALGVDRETVVEDYLVTNLRSAAAVERVLAAFRARGMAEPELLRPLFTADRRYLEAAFEELDAGWADFPQFWRSGLGLDGAMLAGLRENLLEEPL